MTLRQKQSKFARMVAHLIAYAYDIGYEITFGDAYRDVRFNYGHKKSLHRKRLAIDLNLFKDGKYITNNEGHKCLHDYWDRIGGSERISGDMNHYSLEHEGMR